MRGRARVLPGHGSRDPGEPLHFQNPLAAEGSIEAVADAVANGGITALFQPARRRIQQAVDRRFNRRRYDMAKTIDRFSARLRDEVELDTLSAGLLGVVDRTVEPTRASLWLRPSASTVVYPGGEGSSQALFER